MITIEGIKKANESIKTIEVKGKAYACVPARVAAFREMCPDGCISTEIISMADGVVTMMTTVKDETGRVLATGMAQEKEASSYINKTSYIENCETSAIGRALGMIGIGSDASVASAEEVATAINNQSKKALDDATVRADGLALIMQNITPENWNKITKSYGVESLNDLTADHLRDYIRRYNAKKEKE